MQCVLSNKTFTSKGTLTNLLRQLDGGKQDVLRRAQDNTETEISFIKALPPDYHRQAPYLLAALYLLLHEIQSGGSCA